MKKTIIFDVDGTLYYQKKVRIGMAIKLACYYLIHPLKIKELYGIYLFRKYREISEYSSYSIPELIAHLSTAKYIDKNDLEKTIDKWLFSIPLNLIRKYKRENVIEYLYNKKSEGYQIVIYSDYPAEEKLKCLGIEPDHIFYPSADSFYGLKPNVNAMNYIISKAQIDCNDLIYVGDRYEKDGLSAKMVGGIYLDVGKDF